MEKSLEGQETDSPVFLIEGEPAIVINGLPKNMSCGKELLADDSCGMLLADDPIFGDLLEGRKVEKLFGDQYYHGKVVKYYPEMNWYRVVYEDGDFEDLEWHELAEVLLPLDINIPLKLLPFQSFLYGKSVLESKVTMPSTSTLERTSEPCQMTLLQCRNTDKLLTPKSFQE